MFSKWTRWASLVVSIGVLLCVIAHSRPRQKFMQRKRRSMIVGVDQQPNKELPTFTNYPNYLYYDGERECEALCAAQFARDFEEEFGLSYLTQFFDFPIDPLLSSTPSALPRFCRLVHDRQCCLQRECLAQHIVHSPQSHICLKHREDFERAMHCLNVTNSHFYFHAACSKAAKRSIDIDRELAETRGFSGQETENYHQQDLRCRFQACTMHARMQLIEMHCAPGEEADDTHATVSRYYTDDLELDLDEYSELLNATRHFPRFCTAFLAYQKKAVLTIDSEYARVYNKALSIFAEEVDKKKQTMMTN
uniref:DB domain-containing protein n=1 Tax=Globodera pallida TaxID=36090 RepID=A0A183BV11_GLOPA